MAEVKTRSKATRKPSKPPLNTKAEAFKGVKFGRARGSSILDYIFSPEKGDFDRWTADKKDPNIRGSQVPYLYNIIGDFVVNPSTVSVSTFQRMMYTDNLIGACLEYNTSVITNTIGEYYHPIEEVQELVRHALKEVDGGQEKVVRNLLTGMWAGFFVGEKVYKRVPLGIIYDRIIPLPPSTILFAVDPEGRVKPDNGIMQYIYSSFPMGGSSMGAWGYGSGIAPLGMNGDNDMVDPLSAMGDMDFPIRTPMNFPVGRVNIPTKKCIHFIFDSGDVFGNPYGRSLLRKVHKYYLLKDAILQLLVIAMDRKSTPLIVVYTDPRASVDTGNSNERLNAIDAIRDVLGDIHQNTALAVPGKKGETYEFDAVPVQGDLTIFTECLEYIDNAIQQAMLIPDTLFKTGTTGGSYALGSEQSSTHDKLISSIRNSVTRTLVDQFIRPLIELNFGEDYVESEWGYFATKVLSEEQLTTIIENYKLAQEANLVGKDDLAALNKTREKMGFEPTDAPIENNMDGDGEGGGKDSRDKGKKPYKHWSKVK